MKDIVYFESVYRKIYIHTLQGTDCFLENCQLLKKI